MKSLLRELERRVKEDDPDLVFCLKAFTVVVMLLIAPMLFVIPVLIWILKE